MATPIYHSQTPAFDWDPSRSYPPEAVKAEFGRRLQSAMTARGWTQSDLARKADIGRDSVSVYVRGRSLPGPLHLAALARALRIPSDDLMPGVAERTSARVWSAHGVQGSPLEFRLLDDGRAWLRFSMSLSLSQVTRILAIIDPNGVRPAALSQIRKAPAPRNPARTAAQMKASAKAASKSKPK